MSDFLQSGRKKLIFCLLLPALLYTPALADTIFFKDGSVTVCREKAWEEDDWVKCEFYGTVVNYPEGDVDHVETGKHVLPETLTRSDRENASETDKARDQDPAVAASQTSTAVLMGINRSSGPIFYDPRRPHKYWASETSRHDSFDAALNAMAQLFERTPEWVTANMGESNSLAEIHKNLSANELIFQESDVTPPVSVNQQAAPSQQPVQVDVSMLKGVNFYDPRRSKKYWVTKSSHHATLDSAINTLAAQYGRSPEWIKARMGETNDLVEIHRNLSGLGGGESRSN